MLPVEARRARCIRELSWLRYSQTPLHCLHTRNDDDLYSSGRRLPAQKQFQARYRQEEAPHNHSFPGSGSTVQHPDSGSINVMRTSRE